VGEIPRQRGRNGKQNVKGGAQEASAIPCHAESLQAVRSRSPCYGEQQAGRVGQDVALAAARPPSRRIGHWRERLASKNLECDEQSSPPGERRNPAYERGGEHCRRAVGSSGDSATAATKDAGREEPIAPPRLAFTRSSQVRRYSLELEFYSWTLPNRQASRETRLANAP
jgi:hypothetical protein